MRGCWELDITTDAIAESPVELRRLFGPRGGANKGARELLAEPTAEQIVEGLADAWATLGLGRERPYVVANMISTADGRATVEGRSGKIGNAADQQLFHALRSVVDAIMVGAGTARVERYRRVIKSEQTRAARRARGLREEPLALIVSGHLDLPADLPLLEEPQARVVMLTSSEGELPASAAEVRYVRAQHGGPIDLGIALRAVGERFQIRTLLCEGGPHLVGELLEAGLVDELFLSLAPKLAGGEPAQQELRIVAGPDFDPPIELSLLEVFEQDSLLVLRYGASARARA